MRKFKPRIMHAGRFQKITGMVVACCFLGNVLAAPSFAYGLSPHAPSPAPDSALQAALASPRTEGADPQEPELKQAIANFFATRDRPGNLLTGLLRLKGQGVQPLIEQAQYAVVLSRASMEYSNCGSLTPTGRLCLFMMGTIAVDLAYAAALSQEALATATEEAISSKRHMLLELIINMAALTYTVKKYGLQTCLPLAIRPVIAYQIYLIAYCAVLSHLLIGDITPYNARPVRIRETVIMYYALFVFLESIFNERYLRYRNEFLTLALGGRLLAYVL